uniref:Uncharacterized protein n=1 Tax=Anguilla anguilla TaxID=7936 RepID=A0A0E9XWA5_ANGAN
MCACVYMYACVFPCTLHACVCVCLCMYVCVCLCMCVCERQRGCEA